MPRRVEAIPHRVDKSRIGGVSGERVLVVEEVCSVLRDQLRLGPGDAAVSRATRRQSARRTAAARQWQHGALPCGTAVEADGADQRPRATAAPAVLLPGGKNMVAV